MAPTNVAPLVETTQGVAFEIEVKSPKGAEQMTPVRARLESYNKELPTLFKSRNRAAEQTDFASPVKEVASRAHARNEKHSAVVARLKQQKEEEGKSLRTALEKAFDQAADKRSSALADKSLKAGKHFEEVKTKLSSWQQKKNDAETSLQKQIEEVLTSSEEKRSAALAEKSAKAGKHAKVAIEKAEAIQRQKAEASADHERKLKETMALVDQRRETHLAEKVAKARSTRWEPTMTPTNTSQGEGEVAQGENQA